MPAREGARPGALQGRGFGRGAWWALVHLRGSLGAGPPPQVAAGPAPAQVPRCRPRPLRSPSLSPVFTEHLPPLMHGPPPAQGAPDSCEMPGETLLTSGCDLPPQAHTPSPAAPHKGCLAGGPSGSLHPREGSRRGRSPTTECSGHSLRSPGGSGQAGAALGPVALGSRGRWALGPSLGAVPGVGLHPVPSPPGPWLAPRASPQLQPPPLAGPHSTGHSQAVLSAQSLD